MKNKNLPNLFLSITLCILTLGVAQHAKAQTYLISAGSEIYEVDPVGCTETLLCSISVNTGGGTITSTVNDLALHPNGNLYALVSNYFISIDLGTCTSTTIATHATNSNSLVSAADGTLYAAGADLYTVDPISGVFTSLGTLPCTSGGDLAFHDGELYLTCDNGDLIKVDMGNPTNSTTIGNLGTGYWYGLWTVFTDCNNTQVLAATQNELYEVDLNTAATTYNCTLGTPWIAGATMQGDFNASECGCSVNLGLDQNLCNGPVTLNVGNPNLTYLWNDGTTDSVYTISTPGEYFVTVTDTTDGCTNSDTIIVSEPYPPNSGLADSTIVCSDVTPFDLITLLGGNPDTTGVWTPSLNSGNNLFDPSNDVSGTYTYTVTNICGSSSTDLYVDIMDCELGLDNPKTFVSVFPNPTQGYLTFHCSELNGGQLYVYDLSGREVFQTIINSEFQVLDFSNLANGTYTLTFTSTNKFVFETFQIIVVR